ncbi:hypothetical protein [Dyadobacter sp. 676]|uniref:Uncharacterized protein n=1 Tax=Dyadobacter sp. 676 TaxID=3088362 RepID=A0AAU8FL64_9BACT
MELSEEAFHEIHRYLAGQGTAGERADFERRMQADEALAREVETQRRIRDGLKANEYKKLFKDIHAQLKSEGALYEHHDRDETGITPLNADNSSPTGIRWPYIAAAASILVAAGLVWYINFAPDNTQIASETPARELPVMPDTAATKGGTDESADTSKTPVLKPKRPAKTEPVVSNTDFFAQYFRPDLELESPFPKDKLGISPSAFRQWRSDTTHIRQGVRYLAQREATAALPEFRQAEASQFRQVRDAAEWFAALAYLQQNDLKNCEEQLKKISANPENIYNKQAVELLAKIR